MALSYKRAFPTLSPNISIVDYVTFLGIVVETNLKWCFHSNALRRKLALAFYAISVSKEINLPKAKIAYFSLFESHVRYGLLFGVLEQELNCKLLSNYEEKQFGICLASVEQKTAEAISEFTEL